MTSTPEISELIRFSVALAVLLAPGVLLVGALAPDLDRPSRYFVGGATGLALACVGFVWIAGPGIRYAWSVVAIAWVAAAALAEPRRRPRAPAAAGAHAGRWLLVVVALQGALGFASIAGDALPAGSDAIYHVAIAEKFRLTGHWPRDFLPFDPVAPSYPPASHWLCAVLAELSRLPVHRVYQLAMLFALCGITSGVFALGRGWRGPRTGLLAAAAFAGLSNWGGWDLLRWGSLPNALAIVLLVAFVCAHRIERPLVARAAGAVLLAALVQVHHLTLLIGGAAWLGAFAALRREPALRVRLLGQAVWSLAGALVLSAAFLPRYATYVVQRVASGSASAGAESEGLAFFNVAEPALSPWSWLIDLGPLLCAAALVGAWQWRRRRRDASADPHDAPASRLVGAWVWGWIAGVGAAYVALDWVTRAAVYMLTGRDLAILTPSRFLTDLAYPLSVLAGLGLCAVAARGRAALAICLAAIAAQAIVLAQPGRPPSVPADTLASMAFSGAHLPEDALVLGNHPWLTYVSGREGALMALRQEELSPYTKRKRALLAGGRDAIRAWAAEHGRPVYVRARTPVRDPELERVFEQGRERLYRFVPAPAPRRESEGAGGGR
jgi:hypothetical protein